MRIVAKIQSQPNHMKTAITIFAIIISLLFISCRQANKKQAFTTDHTDTTNTFVDKKEGEGGEKIEDDEAREKLDSIFDEEVLQEAIKIAEQHKTHNQFKKHYVTAMRDSANPVWVDITHGFYFSSEYAHLIIRRKTPRFVFIDIFSKTDNQFYKVISHTQWTMEYMGDTIRDVNGDGFKDFVVNWYGSNGCCLKGFSNVYLQRADKKSFSSDFEFINPTFSPEEHIIRGVCYGHPGETEIYKYKWNREAVDTLEYIYYEKSDKGEKTGKLLVSDKPYSENHKVLRRLRYIPAEYKKIEGYDWFTGNLGINSNR